MAYIGKQPSTKFSAAAKQDSFTGDGSTTTFDVANIIPSGGENSLQVFVDNVRQKPGASNAYTIGNDGSGDLKRITFTAAPDASAEIYVITPFEATNIKNVGDGTVTTAKLDADAVTGAKMADDAVNSEHLTDGSVDNVHLSGSIADSKLSTITTASKVNVSSLSAPGSASVFLTGARTYAAVDTSGIDINAFNISLLGFKMAVNEGLTVFNLVDGIVDEFHDESGTDEAEGSNDFYSATCDAYSNSNNPTSFSAGFSTSAVTCASNSTAQTTPISTQVSPYGDTIGTFTVPTGVVDVNLYVWGAGGGTRDQSPGTCNAVGGAGGYSQGSLEVTPTQALSVVVGYGGERANEPSAKGVFMGGGLQVASCHSSSGGGLSGVFAPQMANAPDPGTAPNIVMIAGAGGGGGHNAGTPSVTYGGAGGGLTGNLGGSQTEQTGHGGAKQGGGGDQEQGGQGAPEPEGSGQSGSFLKGGNSVSEPSDYGGGSGGGGYYGGGAGANGPGPIGGGGGGSSYIGHPQISSGSTEEGGNPSGGTGEHACEAGYAESGGIGSPVYSSATPVVANVGDGGPGEASYQEGFPGYVIITGTTATFASPGGGSSTIISNAFAAGSVPTTSRIVVFEENVETPTLNTDIIASISRDGGSNFTTATLSDSGYVTGASGQRILTGQATISGQPSGQSMRWKLALANNTVKIHGVSLQWA